MKGRSVSPSPTEYDTVSELVRRAQAGDLAAFDSLVACFQRMAIHYAAFLLGESGQSDDAAQEAFLEAYRALPSLREPRAFPGWLRLLVKKHCDRITRNRPLLVPLDSLAEQPIDGSLEGEVVRRDLREQVRCLVRDLPMAEREVVTLYYLADRSCAEIARFLGVPVSTVKGRLLTARKRLRERMAPMMEIENTPVPPAEPGFRERLFTRLHEEYKEQLKRNPHTVDRSLLTRARENLLETLPAAGPVDWETAWQGHHILWKLGDIESAVVLLERYLMNALPASEEAWTRRRRLNLLASLSAPDFDGRRRLERRPEQSERDADRLVVADHPVFVRWVQEQASRSQIALPWYGFERMPDSCLPVWALDGVRVAEAYAHVGAFSEFETLAEEILSACPKTGETRLARFDVLAALVASRGRLGRKAEALATAEAIRALGAEEPDHFRNPNWLLEAAMWTIDIENQTDRNSAVIRASGERAIRLSEQWEAHPDAGLTEREKIDKFNDLAEQRHSIGVLLMETGQYDLALRLLDATLAVPNAFSPWTYLWKAACLWAMTKDRSQALPLLAEGYRLALPWRVPGGEQGSGLGRFHEDFQRQREFADVGQDPEFMAAVHGAST